LQAGGFSIVRYRWLATECLPVPLTWTPREQPVAPSLAKATNELHSL
jgi:hypothetical protein